jgi:hypothetical protein
LQLRSRFDHEVLKALIEALGAAFVAGYVAEKGKVDIWKVHQRAVAVVAGVARVVEQYALVLPELLVYV